MDDFDEADLDGDGEFDACSTTTLIFRHLISGSLALVSMIHTWPSLMPGLFLNAHRHGSLPQQLKVV